MKPLLAKEIRLLLPAYGTALLLAIVPVWLLPNDPREPAVIALYAFWFGAVMLALSAFGREFGLNTFPLILAQPLERTRIWWTKVAVLAGAMATVLIAWCLSCAACVYLGLERSDDWRETLTIGGTAAVIIFAGGLWTTLLLRQMAAAFWFTILVPGAILMVIEMSGGTDVVMFAALGLYAVGGFLLARWQFLRVQEAAWTGGVIAFPGRRGAAAASRSVSRARRPLAALCWKELQLHQVGLVGMGWLFLLHLGVVALRTAGQAALGDTMRAALEVFGGIWLLVPLLAGSASVAEERKLGVMEEHLCLPVSSRVQFAIKLLFVLVLGGLLSAVLLWTAEGIGSGVGTHAYVGVSELSFNGPTLGLLSLIFLALALIGFYASTLARSIVQALAAAVVAAIAVWMLVTIAPRPLTVSGVLLWRGGVVYYVGLPTLVVTFLWLAYRNFRCVSESRRLWYGNPLGLAAALVFIAASASVLYNRAWELLLPLEPAHGPARLVGPKPTTLHSYGGAALTVLLPDGRLWVDRVAYDPGRLFVAFGEGTGIRAGGKWVSLSGNHIVAGSTWVSAAANFRETVAIRSDGTLWVSERLRQPWDSSWEKGTPPAEEPAGLVRFGTETNWQSVVRDYWSDSVPVVLLKQDGTLWRGSWTTNSPGEKKREWLGLRSFAPHRLGTESDWARLIGTGPSIYVWKRDGRAWVLHPLLGRKPKKQEVTLDPWTVIERLESFDNIKWRSLTHRWPLQAAVREDGTLWAWTVRLAPGPTNGEGFSARPPVQIGKDTDWVAVAGVVQMLAALKADGSLWEWNSGYGRREESELATESPVRLGTHNDWVAVGSTMEGIVSLAADGSLWHWWTRDRPYYSAYCDQPMLAASRRPSKIENIFGERE